MSTQLRKFRLALGLTAPGLARKSDTHTPLVYKLENGREKAGPRVRARMAAALGQPESALFDPQGWPLSAEEGQ